METRADHNKVKDIGGFFELELPRGNFYHSGTLRLNSARSCLRYIVRLQSIKQVFVPSYTCPVVWETLWEEGCEIKFYEIGEDLLPTSELPKEAWIIYNTYFGICSQQGKFMIRRYPNLILDHSQSYYCALTGKYAIYSPRKFFGVPDGGELLAPGTLDQELPRDCSLDHAIHLLTRIEHGANAAYVQFRKSEETISRFEVKRISHLTERILQGINYVAAAERRRNNFMFLHNCLKSENRLTLTLRMDEVPMIYPLLTGNDGESIKKKLIDRSIYVATYWKGQKSSEFGRELEDNLIALPVDQRYGDADMRRIVEALHE